MEDGGPIWLVILFILCLAGSFYFSGTEMAFATVNRIRMRGYAENGDKRAKRVLYVLNHFEKALTTILIGNNIVNISAATIATILATRLWGASSVTAVTLVVTLLVFLLAETLPKTFAKACNEQYAMKVAGSLTLLMRVFTPFTYLFDALTRAVQKPFRHLKKNLPTVTEDELYDILEDAVEEGALDEETGELVHSAIAYTNAAVRDILTPWKDVLKLSLSMTQEQILLVIKQNGHSRLPVINATGEVVGLLRIRKYLGAVMRDGDAVPLEDIMDPAHFVRDTMDIDDLLPEMSRIRTHFSFVQDQWDNVVGVVTMEDILETLVGEIYDEDDVREVKAHAR